MKNSPENMKVVPGKAILTGTRLAITMALMVVATVVPLFTPMGVWYTVMLGVTAILWAIVAVICEQFVVRLYDQLQAVSLVKVTDVIDALQTIDNPEDKDGTKGDK